jgi:hypothetical protein
MGEGIGNRKKEKKKELIKFEYEKDECKKVFSVRRGIVPYGVWGEV